MGCCVSFVLICCLLPHAPVFLLLSSSTDVPDDACDGETVMLDPCLILSWLCFIKDSPISCKHHFLAGYAHPRFFFQVICVRSNHFLVLQNHSAHLLLRSLQVWRKKELSTFSIARSYFSFVLTPLFWRSVLSALLFTKSTFYVNTARVDPSLLGVENSRLRIADSKSLAICIMTGTVTESYLKDAAEAGPRHSPYGIHKVTIAPFEQDFRRDMSVWGMKFGDRKSVV